VKVFAFMLAAVLVQFYRRASAVFISPATYAGELWRSLAYNRRILLRLHFNIPAGSVCYIDAMQRRFLNDRPS
jgi:hypothetical protein